MFRTLLLGAALAACASSAHAADLIVDEVEMTIPDAEAYWSGAYAGVHVGYGWGSVTVDPLDDDDSAASGWLAGAQIGINGQVDNFVGGLELDGDWSNITNADAVNGADVEGLVELNWLTTLRARLGFAVDSVLIYGTAGMALGGITYTDTDLNPDETDTDIHGGWVAGAGVEIGVTENISAKVEYLYVDLAGETYNLGVPDTVSLRMHTVKTGVNFRF